MLNPAIGKLINHTSNRYELVLNVAHRARKIADIANENGDMIVEKPVTIAINQMAKKIDD